MRSVGITVAFFCLFILSGPAQGPNLPITFETPKSWNLLESKDQRGSKYFLYEIKSIRNAGKSSVPSNALVTLYKIAEGVSFADADSIVNSRLKNATAIASGQDGENWKTYIYATYEGTQQVIILYRIGMQNGYGVEAMISFPHVAVKNNKTFKLLALEESAVKSESITGLLCNPTTVSEMVDLFNDFCSKLKISGTNRFYSRVKLIDPRQGAKYYHKVD